MTVAKSPLFVAGRIKNCYELGGSLLMFLGSLLQNLMPLLLISCGERKGSVTQKAITH